MSTTEQKMSWNDFRAHRFHASSFWGVVDKEGNWVDSAIQFHVAVDFAGQSEGLNPHSMTALLMDMSQTTVNVVHSSMLEKMYNAGLLK